LEEAAELAMELELFSLASRAFVNLCNLVLEEDDDVERHRHYSHLAMEAAKRADNVFDLQTALFQGLRGEMLGGNEKMSCLIESQLLPLRTGDEARTRALGSFRAVRVAWNGKFSEAHHILGRTWHLFHYDFDRVMAGALCGLLLAVDGRRTDSSRLVTEVVRQAGAMKSAKLFSRRRAGVARLYCAIAEGINGRPLQAATIVRQLSCSDDDRIVRLVGNLAEAITTSLRHAATSDAEVERAGIVALAEHGYVDAVRILNAIRGALEERTFLKRLSLTPAEVAVMRYLNQGASPKEIAARTGRSIFTVRAHIANAIGKLRCHGRAEAVAVVRRLGLID
jgi:DNA-binding CsgD family transcriptional regulator